MVKLDFGSNVTLQANLDVPTDADWNILDFKQNIKTHFAIIHMENQDGANLGIKEIIFYGCD